MTDGNSCKNCLANDATIMEDSAHALGECPAAKDHNNHTWKEIVQLRQKYKLHTATWIPWFHTNLHTHNNYNMSRHLGDKGLTPKQFRSRVYLENTHIPKTK